MNFVSVFIIPSINCEVSMTNYLCFKKYNIIEIIRLVSRIIEKLRFNRSF
jgi:hypothetical protein